MPSNFCLGFLASCQISLQAQFQTLVEPSTANELRPEDTIPPVSPQAIIAPPQSTAVPDAPSFTVENHVPELVEPKRRSGKSTRKVSESGRRKKSSDSAASEDCGDQENAIPVVTVSLEQKQAKRSKGSKRR